MTEQQLRALLTALGAVPPDVLRACLYVHELQATATFLQNTLAGVLGNDYVKVRAAVQDPTLLTTLCAALDPFVVEAVNADLTNRANGLPHPPADFTQYYTDTILTNYPADRIAFYNNYPRTRDIVQAISNNFRNNIQEACQRIIQDWHDLETMFLPAGTILTRLIKIKSSGSDFHKGGKQVLLLTFQTYGGLRDLVNYYYSPSTIQLAYKPGDLEADCLIIGDSQAVNSVIPNFQVQSLFELLNVAIAQAKTGNPNLNLETLPTYKILPRDYGSSLPTVGNTVNIRRSYGYIEYLHHNDYEPYDFMLKYPSILSYYPFGSSDYKIFPGQNLAQIAQKFYRLIGQITAIASTFSIIDLHVENIIVHKYLPYPIDMEICLSTLVQQITDTSLYGRLAGVTGVDGPDDPIFTDGGNQGNLFINSQPKLKPQQNRLWTIIPLAMVDPQVYAAQICKGYRDMIDVLQQMQNNNTFNPWLARLTQGHGVIVRYLPLATEDFRAILTSASNEVNCHDLNKLNVFIAKKRGDMYLQWFNDPNWATLDPKFMALQDTFVLQDYQNADIPIFYHRVGSQNIMDSQGVQVAFPAVPPDLTYIPDVNQPANVVTVAHVNLGPARGNNFFAQPPLQMHIINGQLQTIAANVTKTPRIQAIVGGVLQDLHLGFTPADVRNILQ